MGDYGCVWANDWGRERIFQMSWQVWPFDGSIHSALGGEEGTRLGLLKLMGSK